jgi:hypothetical protein
MAEVDVGQRGTLVSWQCELSLDATARATGTGFSPWIVPVVPGPIDRALEGALPH